MVQLDTSRCTKIYKVIVHKYYDIITMKNVIKKKYWLSGDITTCFEPPPIPLIKSKPVVVKKNSDYVKSNFTGIIHLQLLKPKRKS